MCIISVSNSAHDNFQKKGCEPPNKIQFHYFYYRAQITCNTVRKRIWAQKRKSKKKSIANHLLMIRRLTVLNSVTVLTHADAVHLRFETRLVSERRIHEVNPFITIIKSFGILIPAISRKDWDNDSCAKRLYEINLIILFAIKLLYVEIMRVPKRCRRKRAMFKSGDRGRLL